MILTVKHFENTKYGRLKMLHPQEVTSGSHKKYEWICDCGKITIVEVCLVVSGNTTSCGKCNFLTSEHFDKTKYNKLWMLEPKDIYGGTRKKVEWVCDCGNITSASVLGVTIGHATSCGKCNTLSAEHFKNTKYGKLKMLKPTSITKGSHKKVEWLCDCGNITRVSLYTVTSGMTASCNQCNLIKAADWSNLKFGRLRMKTSGDYKKFSNKVVSWICDCGNTKEYPIYDVTLSNVVSCGHCREIGHKWYLDNQSIIKSLKTPIQPEHIPQGWIQFLEPITNMEKPTPAICGVCKNEYKPRWGNIKQGRSLTCGCASNHVSFAAKQIAEFIRSLGVEVELEYEIDGLKYDILVPSKNLLIEYNGLKWHGGEDVNRKRRDIEKYKIALINDYSFLMVFEDEWLESRHKIENLLRNKLNTNFCVSLRPKQCVIQKVPLSQSEPFYEIHHYIGACKSSMSYGAYYQDKLIACTTFKHPTRQSKYPWELIRMVSDPAYRVHGIWSKLLRVFIQDHNPSSIVSFSDNRLFDGKVYEKIGFKFDGDVNPDYYWCKNNKRYHKSGLRKKGEERTCGLTEIQLRTADGYRRVWDLGKKRWILVNSPINI
jgi:hypothetical protein